MSVEETVLLMLDKLTLREKINYIKLKEESFLLAMDYLIKISEVKGGI